MNCDIVTTCQPHLWTPETRDTWHLQLYDCNVCIDTCPAQPAATQSHAAQLSPRFPPSSDSPGPQIQACLAIWYQFWTKQNLQTIWDNNILTMKDCWSQQNLRHLLVMSWRSGDKNCLMVSVQHYGGRGGGQLWAMASVLSAQFAVVRASSQVPWHVMVKLPPSGHHHWSRPHRPL